MKFIAVLAAILFSTFAQAETPFSITHKDKAAPSYLKAKSKVETAVKAYRVLEKDMGEIRSWTCKGFASDEGDSDSYSDITSCSVLLDLPADYCYYGSFKLVVEYERATDKVVSMKYDWTREY